MIDKKIDEKEAEELKKIYNSYLDKKTDIMKNTLFKVEDAFGDVINKDNFSQEQIAKFNIFFSQIDVNIYFSIKINLFKPRKKKSIDYQPRVLPYYE